MGGQLVCMVLTELPAVFLCVQAAYEFENISGAEERAILKTSSSTHTHCLLSVSDKSFMCTSFGAVEFFFKVKDSTEAAWFVQAHYRLQTTESHGMQIRLLGSNEFPNQMYTDDDNNWWSTDGPPVILVFIYSPHTPPALRNVHFIHNQCQLSPKRHPSGIDLLALPHAPTKNPLGVAGRLRKSWLIFLVHSLSEIPVSVHLDPGRLVG
ncbi:hypothetical protein D9758_001419 [Tetrapyrgos nigripes]|uniref:MAM domain-containing protein n=1 Tax=Tetrapyrgos nigripes TaxID=182062 RepID=A0A8H5LUF0_9AGAR|nr:hypothetical protein D9758_001419 [Tetrapyrgos nigripes]